MHNCNITQTHFDKEETWSGILAAAEFAIRSTKNRLKGYSTGQLVFGHDMIILIKHKVDRELIRKQKRTQINKENICKDRNQVDHDYNVIDKLMLNDNSA